MSEFFDSLERSMQQAVEIAAGRMKPAAIHHIEVPVPDVQAIRARTGLSQGEFARSIGVKKATLLNWEQKRRRPEGPARVLLAMIEREPGIVQRVLAE